MGEIITISGTIIENTDRSKEASGKPFLLEVKAVNGKPLPKPIITSFNPSAFTNLSQPTIGGQFTYVGYETGGFTGTPPGEFKYIPAYASTSFHFTTYFLVLGVPTH